jgi:malate dehydrogenase (oxaloacetate-decarboxylating)(NADP+)
MLTVTSGNAIHELRPNALIGVCGKEGLFSGKAPLAAAEKYERLGILAQSNPISPSECTAKQDYSSTEGLGIFASANPCGSVDHGADGSHPDRSATLHIPKCGYGSASVRRTSHHR